MTDDHPLTPEDICWTLDPLVNVDTSISDAQTQLSLLLADVVDLENEIRIYRELLQASMALNRELTQTNERLTITLRDLHDRLPPLASR